MTQTIKYYLILLFVLGLIYPCKKGYTADLYVMDKNCKWAYDQIFNLQFDKATEYLKKSKQENPQNLMPVYLDNYMDFLRVFISENQGLYDKLQKNKSIRLEWIEKKGAVKSPYYRYVKADILLQWAFARIKYGDYYTSAKEIYEAYSLLEENTRLYPNFILNKKGMGVLHALIGTIPDNYKWVVKMIGLEGTVRQGIDELKMLHQFVGNNLGYKYCEKEIYFYISFLSVNLIQDKAVWEEWNKRGQQMQAKSGPLMVFSRVALLKKLGRNEEVISLLKGRMRQVGEYDFYYLDFLLGEAYLYKLEEKLAVYYLQRYVSQFKGSHYHKAAWLRLAWAYQLMGDEKRRQEAMNNIAIYGKAQMEDDEYALKQFEKKDKPNVYLLKSRLLFDGGYYKASLEELRNYQLQIKDKSVADMLECNYRIGRNYHQMNRYDEALRYYRLAIKGSNSRNPDYYAANAALQIGVIYELLGKREEAISAYRACLKMESCPYKGGIDQKAKAGLSRLNAK